MTSKPSTADNDPERRTDQRVNTRLEAVVGDPREGLVFTASGFSRTGAFLRRGDGTTPLPAVGSIIRLMFRWPLETQIPPVHVEARVIRQTEDGIGVQFEIA